MLPAVGDRDTHPSRLAREKRTVANMIAVFCRGNHGTYAQLCPECEELHRYALCRLNRCPFGSDKPVCSKCPVHCYNSRMRYRVKAVMRYAGPRMLLRHPVLTIGHMIDKRRPVRNNT